MFSFLVFYKDMFNDQSSVYLTQDRSLDIVMNWYEASPSFLYFIERVDGLK